LNPELKIIGGKKKLKKRSDENLKVFATFEPMHA
jgi:hypothetical protein